MVATEKLISKFNAYRIKKRELETLLQRLGFKKYGGKGSHEVWGHPDHSDVHFVIATHGKDVPRYQIKQIEKSLKTRGII